ncbi:hypothetical protein HK102_006423, partial [Quaeritorhiza haematococci]
VRLVSVVGKPIEVPRERNPSREMVEEWHGRYVRELVGLYEMYREEFEDEGYSGGLTRGVEVNGSEGGGGGAVGLKFGCGPACEVAKGTNDKWNKGKRRLRIVE